MSIQYKIVAHPYRDLKWGIKFISSNNETGMITGGGRHLILDKDYTDICYPSVFNSTEVKSYFALITGGQS